MFRTVLATLLLASLLPCLGASDILPGERQIVMKGGGYFPVLIRLHNGDLLAVVRGGGQHIDVRGRLDLLTSKDNGKTWSAPRTVVDGPSDDRNPALGQLKDGTIILSYVILSGYDKSGLAFQLPGRENRPFDGVYVMRSGDNGASWSKPVRSAAIHSFYEGKGAVSPFGKIDQLADGTALMSVYFDFRDGRGLQTYLFRSRDSGQTWSDPALVGTGMGETSILVLKNGTILAAMRSVRDAKSPTTESLSITSSSDKGRTWSAPVLLTGAREHPADLLELADGRIVLCYGERNAPFGIRALVSTDHGQTWSKPLLLSNDAPNIDSGYPSSVQLPGGRLLTLYYQVQDASSTPASAEARAVIWSLPR